MEKQVSHTPRIRALFLDIDGTIIGMEERVSPAVAEALAAAQAQGCHVVLCTGRTRYRTLPIVESLGEPYGYFVTSNGSVAAHAGRGEILYRHLMPIPLALEVVRAIVAVGSEPYVFEDSDRPGMEGNRVLYHPDMPVGRWADIPRYRPYERILEELPFEPVSVSAFGPAERIRPLVEQLQTRLAGAVSIVRSGSEWNWGIEIYVPGISKQVGIEYVANHLGCQAGRDDGDRRPSERHRDAALGRYRSRYGKRSAGSTGRCRLCDLHLQTGRSRASGRAFRVTTVFLKAL